MPVLVEDGVCHTDISVLVFMGNIDWQLQGKVHLEESLLLLVLAVMLYVDVDNMTADFPSPDVDTTSTPSMVILHHTASTALTLDHRFFYTAVPVLF